jgi:hypothetical protein
MRWVYVCLAVGLLLVVAPAGALVPDGITINTDVDWLTAGSGETATVTVQVTNSTPGNTSFEGVEVELAVDGEYGSISPGCVELDSSGSAAATFRPGTLSGTAEITATVLCDEMDEPLVGSGYQKIDHATPYRIANIWYSPRVTAGGTTDITVQMADRYGNIVDDRREAEAVKFMVGSPEGRATFDGGTDEITKSVDESGNATVTLKVSTLAGMNTVYIQHLELSQYISVRGMADGVPAAISCMVEPSGASVPANGKDKITLMYMLTDVHGNPAGGQGVWVNSSGLYCQQKLVYSSSWGEVWVTYGPEDSIGIVDIIATAVESPDVTVSETIEFTSTEPVKMVLTASPQSMASRDLNDDIVSELRARVMDIKGNPVDGEEVTFTIITESIDCSGGNSTGAPCLGDGRKNLTTATATTVNGTAVVEFHPGAFAKPEGRDRATAKGTVTVRAVWENKTLHRSDTRTIDLTWMNYPYLSVETEVSDTKVSVNSTSEHTTNITDVTIRLKGDGYAMEPDPIDVVLVIDTSGSMDGTDVSPTRMKATKEAAKDFVNEMNLVGSLAEDEGDQVALISFAFNAELKQGLTQDSDEVKRAIGALSAVGGTNMRLAYYTAIKHLKENGRPEAIKAVVFMGDGDWNYHGSPLAKGVGYADNNRYLTSDWYSSPYFAPLSAYRWSGNDYSFSSEKYEWYSDLPDPKGAASATVNLGTGTWYDTESSKSDKRVYNFKPTSNICKDGYGQFTNQNMSIYANSGDDTEKVRIYTIGFASKLNTNVEEDLRVLSEATGGKYVWAGNAEDLKRVYTDIAGELKTEAGVDTSMTVFQNVEINEAPKAAFEVFDYRYVPDKSTAIESWIKNETGNHTIISNTTDQTKDWKEKRQLHFDIGTIHLNQVWEATFRIAVNASYEADEENNVNIFGPGAVILFNNKTEELELPDTYITVFPDLTSTGATTSSLDVAFTEPEPGSGPYTGLIPLSWVTTYKGTKGVDISLAYSRHEDMRAPVPILTRTLPASSFMSAGNTTTDSTTIAVNNLEPGQYWITVTASARDAKAAEDTTNVWAHTRDVEPPRIKIS